MPASGVARVRVRRVRRQLGVAELLVVRVGLRHRRLAVPPGDDGADGRRRHPLARPAADVRVDRPRRHARQPRGGRRLRGHAHGARVPVVAGVAARSRATADRALLHAPGRASPRSAGWRSPSPDLPVGHDVRRAARSWSRSSSPARSSPSARARTPWHPHHIAERYGLLVIITLGEVIIGTVAALNALVHGEAGWTRRRRAARPRRRRADVRLLVDVLRGALGRAARPPTASARSSSATGTS